MADKEEAFIKLSYSQVNDKSVDVKLRKKRLKRMLGQLYTTRNQLNTAREQLKKSREEKQREITELKKQHHRDLDRMRDLAMKGFVARSAEKETVVVKAKAKDESLTRPAKNITTDEVTVEGVKYRRWNDERIIDFQTGSPWGTYDAKKKTVTFETRKLKLHERRKK